MVERGLVFLPTGSPSYDFYGADRKGQNLFGNSVIALKAGTGQLVWYFQTVHHDIWDYDLPAQPNLVTVTAGGLVFIGGANDSRLRAFDSSTGKELWAAEIEAGGHATPMTYLGRKTSRQYVVIAAGGAGYMSEKASDAVVAFALP